MDNLTIRQVGAIAATFLVAILLAVVPTPGALGMFWPDWVAIVLVYWCIAIPERLGIGIAWMIGLLLDGLYGSLLGEQALAKALIAYLALRFYLRLRLFPRWQQAVAIGAIIALSDIVILMIKSLVHGNVPIWRDAAPMAMNVVLWPFVFFLLREVRRRARIS